MDDFLISKQHGLAPKISVHDTDPFLYQGQDPTCAIRCQAIIGRCFGIDMPMEELIHEASINGWYNGGTPIQDIGKLLGAHNISNHQIYGASIEQLCNELDAGKKIIVAIDAKEIWGCDNNMRFENIKDVFLPDPNHALILDGIDTDKGIVTLTDSAYGDHRIEYPLDKFIDAHNDSGNFACITDSPALYEYSGNGHMELTDYGVELIRHNYDYALNDHNMIIDDYMINNHISPSIGTIGSQIDVDSLDSHISIDSMFTGDNDFLDLI